MSHEFPPIGAGASTAAAQTARALVQDGHDVLVITAGRVDLASVETWEGVAIERLPTLRLRTFKPSAFELLSFCASAWLSLQRRLRRFRAEGVIAYFAVPAGYFAVRAAGRLDLPVIVSLRGSDVPGFKQGRLDSRFGSLAHSAIRSALCGADVVAPNGDQLSEMILEFMPEVAGKIAVVENGICPDSLAPKPASSHSDVLHVATVSQLIERKRVHLAIEAVELVAADGTPVKLTIVGDGPQRAELERRAARVSNVELTGRLDRDEILPLLREHDAFIMTSAAEGISNAMLEALASGLPVVTTANGSHHVISRANCGVVTSSDRPQDLADALRELCDRAHRHRLGAAALEYARHHTWSDVARQFAGLLG